MIFSTNLIISPADVQRPVMLLSDYDSVLRDILAMGQDPRSWSLLLAIVVPIGAGLSILYPILDRPRMRVFLLDISRHRLSAVCLRQRGEKELTSSSDFS